MKKKIDIKDVHYQEIPSIMTNDDGELYVAHGLHVVMKYANKKADPNYHKLYISNSFITNYKAYDLSPNVFTVYDMLAFHVFRYLKERCYFCDKEWQVLWRLLRKSNSLRKTIKKFISLMKRYYLLLE